MEGEDEVPHAMSVKEGGYRIMQDVVVEVALNEDLVSGFQPGGYS